MLSNRTLSVVPAIAAAFVLLASSITARSEPRQFKQVAAPAEDIRDGRVVLPDPSACATLSGAAITPIELTWEPGIGWSFEHDLAVESTGPLALALLAPDAARWVTSVRLPGGAYVPLERAFTNGRVVQRIQLLEEEFSGWSVARFDIANAPGGTWRLRVSVPESDPLASPATGFLLARGSSAIGLSTHVTSLMTLSDGEVGIVAHLFDSNVGGSRSALRDVARSGIAFVDTSSGARSLALFDDGAHDDGQAGDGVFGARLPRWISGEVRARIELYGVTPQGFPLVRTAQLAFPVIERRTALTGVIDATVEDDTCLRIEIDALALGPAAKLHVSAEAWGTNAAGELVPVCWLSRMLLPEERDGSWKLPLFLDARWLDVAHATPPLVLRNVRVQDPDTDVPFDVADWLALEVATLPPLTGIGASGTAPPAWMSISVAPPAHPTRVGLAAPIASAPIQRALMLVHGYCSSGSIWPAADFTQPKYEFLDPSANRTHDQFAQLLMQAGSPFSTFGVVAHSQGGMAALHLYTYYTSGLDFALGPRRIQSVCSPYQGTPLASLGGFSCGVNTDMTPAGSATWLAGIPTWARAEVWYWTTSNSGSACNIFTDFLLTNPDDGVIEQFRGQLPGAHSMGHVLGWCHTTGMSNPAAYTDPSRNAQMNTQAAR